MSFESRPFDVTTSRKVVAPLNVEPYKYAGYALGQPLQHRPYWRKPLSYLPRRQTRSVTQMAHMMHTNVMMDVVIDDRRKHC